MEDRFIIGRFEDDAPDSLEEFQPLQGGLSIKETVTTLTGRDVEIGVFGTYVEKESEEVSIGGHGAQWETEVRTVVEGCNIMFDPEAGALYGDTSAVEHLFEALTNTGLSIARVQVDCSRWHDDLEDRDDGHVWMRGWREGDEDDPDDVGVEYHLVTQSRRGEEVNQFGWRYERDGMWFSGYAAASGYVGLHSPAGYPAEHVAAWLREDVLPYTHFEYEDPLEQRTLSESVQDDREIRTDGGLDDPGQGSRRSALQQLFLSTLLIVGTGAAFVAVEGVQPELVALLAGLVSVLSVSGKFRVSPDGEMVFDRGGRR